MSQHTQDLVGDENSEEVMGTAARVINLPPLPQGPKEAAAQKQRGLTPQIRGDPPIMMSNTELFNQIFYMGNTIKSMTARIKEMERERHYTLGGHREADIYYPSVGDKYQFGYDPRNETINRRGNHLPHLERCQPDPTPSIALGRPPSSILR